jgi:C4-dicarboxylate-specific signal transduction histidine kinase
MMALVYPSTPEIGGPCLQCQHGIAGLLHDLGQPLAAIRALASAASAASAAAADAGPAALPDELSERLRQISELGEWMNDLLRTGSITPAGRTRRSSADADQVVMEVLLAAAASFTGTIRWHPSGPALVRADPVDLRRAVANVVDNAARAAGPDGWVQVRIVRGRRQVGVEVEDNGPGFGLIRSHSRRGLAVTQRVLNRYAGVLEIGSGRSGGAVVRLKLPRAVVRTPA